MQCVFLAAGRGSRMKELTETMPKPMLPVAGKPLLQHKLEALPQEIDEVIMVVGYFGHVVQQHFGGEFEGKRILYVEQENPVGGTADALKKAELLLKDRFLVMNGDNLYGTKDMAACAQYAWAVGVQEREHVATGRVVVDDEMYVTDIAENSAHGGEKGYANTALYSLDMRIFEYALAPKAPGANELGLPQTMLQALPRIKIKAVPVKFWFEIKIPEDLARAGEILANRA